MPISYNFDVNKLSQRGIINPVLVVAIVIICLAGVWYFNNIKQNNTLKPSSKQTSAEEIKKDKDWMYKYCVQEIAKLPEAPFKYKQKLGPERNGPMVWVSAFFPKDIRFDHKSGCAMDYKFNDDEAYASLGVKNGADIKYTNEFQKRVDELLTSKIDSSWKKISPLGKEESGNPFYAYMGFPMVFTRENQELGTVEYIDIFFGALTLYIKIEFYEK